MKKQQLFHAFFFTFSPGMGIFPPSGNIRGDLSVQTERSKGGFGRRRMLLGRAKSCRWQVFVRRRPPKQGELRTDVSKATMFQGVDSVLRPRFKALSKKILAECSNGTSRNRLFAQNGGEKALNRCEVPALQHKIRAKSKRTAVFFANSRLRVVEMGSGG